jgi:hypothetical protein
MTSRSKGGEVYRVLTFNTEPGGRNPRSTLAHRLNRIDGDLEDNYRVYKVVDGTRSAPFQKADIKHHDGWTTIRVTMKGDHIECYYDGKKYLDARDSTITGPGKIGLWSKADARSQFDQLTLKGEDDDDDKPGEKKR